MVMPKIDKLILLGGGELLFKFLKLNLFTWKLQLKVITSPRHSEEMLSNGLSLKQTLIDLNIVTLVTNQLNPDVILRFIDGNESTLGISFGAAWVFKHEIINRCFEKRLINIHGTRLPNNKGGGGFSWQIMRGSRLGACTVHLIDTGVDTGDILFWKEFIFPNHCRKPIDYQNTYLEIALTLLKEKIGNLIQESIDASTYRQVPFFSTYNPRINSLNNSWINWSWSAEDVVRFICAFDDPYPGAMTQLNGNLVKIKSATFEPLSFGHHPYESGIVHRNNFDWIQISAINGIILAEDITDEAGNSLIRQIQEGDRFISPEASLINSINRARLGPSGFKET